MINRFKRRLEKVTDNILIGIGAKLSGYCIVIALIMGSIGACIWSVKWVFHLLGVI